jgi:hypothetical protein
MSVDVTSAAPPGASLRLRPRVNWSKQMIIGERYLVTVDLALVREDNTPAPWPFLGKEEITYTLALGGSGFDQWAVDDAAVVLHRFGGSYGPAEFVVTPVKEGERALWLTIINPGGILIGDHPLEVTVVPKSGGQPRQHPSGDEKRDPEKADSGQERLVSAGAAPENGDPAQDALPRDLRVPAADEDDSLLVGNGHVPGPMRTDPAEPTRRDFAYADPDHAGIEDPLARLFRSPAELEPSSESAPPAEPDQDRPPLQLAEWYHVLGLSRSPSGGLHLGLLPLFAPGDNPGKRVTFTARCAPTDEYGTVFAVIAELPDGTSRQRKLRSVQSARIPPGSYEVTAELLYPFPGHVRFHGLPTMPRNDGRRWSAIMAAVPERLGDGAGPAHLVAAIEVSGSAEEVSDRIDAVRRLFSYVAAQSESPVSYSVITYGPHAINRLSPEVPMTTPAWTVTSDVAIDVLDRLSRLPAAPVGYHGAAQIECVLAELDGRLTGAEGRPVVVTVGVRPAHPRATSASALIPCVYRNDWRLSIERLLRQHAGIAFGAIHDTGWPDEMWRFLGNDAGIALADFTAAEFARSLGLTAGYAQLLPLPLIDGLRLEGSSAP